MAQKKQAREMGPIFCYVFFVMFFLLCFFVMFFLLCFLYSYAFIFCNPDTLIATARTYTVQGVAVKTCVCTDCAADFKIIDNRCDAD